LDTPSYLYCVLSKHTIEGSNTVVKEYRLLSCILHRNYVPGTDRVKWRRVIQIYFYINNVQNVSNFPEQNFSMTNMVNVIRFVYFKAKQHYSNTRKAFKHINMAINNRSTFKFLFTVPHLRFLLILTVNNCWTYVIKMS